MTKYKVEIEGISDLKMDKWIDEIQPKKEKELKITRKDIESGNVFICECGNFTKKPLFRYKKVGECRECYNKSKFLASIGELSKKDKWENY